MVTLCCSEETHPAKLRSLLGEVMTGFMRAEVLGEASSDAAFAAPSSCHYRQWQLVAICLLGSSLLQTPVNSGHAGSSHS